MAGLFDYLLQKATGKRRSDIELENESGEVDPRLPKPGQVGEAFGKAARTLKAASEEEGTTAERLQKAGKRFRDENRKAAGR